MNDLLKFTSQLACLISVFFGVIPAQAAPGIDPIGNLSIPKGKSLIVPVTASSTNGRPLAFTATSSSAQFSVEIHTNNPFWKISVAQAAASNAPGAFQTPFRGTFATVTNIGDMTFMLFRDVAPHAVDVFSGLTFSGFYTANTIFHRVITGFVIQGGDPETNGLGGTVIQYDDELKPTVLYSGNGQLGLANSAKDADSSQFFVTMGPQRALDFRYTIFGQLVRGFNVMTNIGSVATNANGRPLADVIITRASIVPDTTDTVLTLVAPNLAGIQSTITLVADDGAGGRATNVFVATIGSDTNNAQALLYPATMTNTIGPVNTRLTNTIAVLDLEGDPFYWFPSFADQASASNALNSSFDGGLGRLVIVPNSNYVGPIDFITVVSPSVFWNYFPTGLPFDLQTNRFVIGDTPISATPVNFTMAPLRNYTNQLLATFTNRVPNSSPANFSVFINWGDNTTNSGVITTNLAGQKEVRGSHMYTSSGDYPVYVTIRSALGVNATVVSTVSVPPTLIYSRQGTNNVLRRPAWASDYQPQSSIELTSLAWAPVTNPFVLVGYEAVLTNYSKETNLFYRLKR